MFHSRDDQIVKKALILSAFFIATIFTSAQSAPLAASCPEFIASESARIVHIHDGDTVKLNDNRKVRLIGIDTPELARRRGTQQLAEQPFAIEARDFARELIHQHGTTVKLMAGTEPRDKYGRYLFHIQLSDGSLLQTRLIEAGLAIAYTTPPNQRFSHCYQIYEATAKKQVTGFWSHPRYQTIESTALTPDDKGFHRLKGHITHIGESKKAFWLNFEGVFSARIKKSDLHYFDLPLQQWQGKTVIIKGWLHPYKNKTQMSLRHPSAIEIVTR